MAAMSGPDGTTTAQIFDPEWQIGNPSIVQQDYNRNFRALAPGATTVTASLHGAHASGTLTVEDVSPDFVTVDSSSYIIRFQKGDIADCPGTVVTSAQFRTIRFELDRIKNSPAICAEAKARNARS